MNDRDTANRLIQPQRNNLGPNEQDSYASEESQAAQNAQSLGLQNISSKDRTSLAMAVLPSPAHIK